MMKADSRLNEEVEGSSYNGILWQVYWELCQSVSLKLQSQTMAYVRWEFTNLQQSFDQ